MYVCVWAWPRLCKASAPNTIWKPYQDPVVWLDSVTGQWHLSEFRKHTNACTSTLTHTHAQTVAFGQSRVVVSGSSGGDGRGVHWRSMLPRGRTDLKQLVAGEFPVTDQLTLTSNTPHKHTNARTHTCTHTIIYHIVEWGIIINSPLSRYLSHLIKAVFCSHILFAYSPFRFIQTWLCHSFYSSFYPSAFPNSSLSLLQVWFGRLDIHQVSS